MSVFAYVLNMRGEPLMPTTPRMARILLKEGKARVVKRSPFTIQLKHATGEANQPVTLGIDPGYSKIGFSAITDKMELISGVVSMRSNVSKKITERRNYRKSRRSKLWYRKPRFLNRKREVGWLPPSLDHKLQTHLRIVEKIRQILPISNIIVEVANFDTQRMQNPEIKGMEYQQGVLHGYEVREYLLEKWGRRRRALRQSTLRSRLRCHGWHADPGRQQLDGHGDRLRSRLRWRHHRFGERREAR